MNTTIINDCRDDNAVGRQVMRAASLIGGNVSFVGVSNDLEAGGNLIDILDAYGDLPGVVLVNVAPRNGPAKKWENGTPFAYFRYKNVLVVSSIDGYTLSLVKKLQLTKAVTMMNIPTVMERFVSEGVLSPEVGERTVRTQFRSFDFLPRVAAYLLERGDVDGEVYGMENIADAPSSVWWVDVFGNCKTTLFKDELEHRKDEVDEKFSSLSIVEQLKDVPDNTAAFTVGSSGLGSDRFVEIVVQGDSAAQVLGMTSGDAVLR